MGLEAGEGGGLGEGAEGEEAPPLSAVPCQAKEEMVKREGWPQPAAAWWGALAQQDQGVLPAVRMWEGGGWTRGVGEEVAE